MHLTSRLCLFATVGLLVTGCGTGAPDADELASALRSPDSVMPIPVDQADCVASVLLDADLDADVLNAIADGDTTYQGSSDDQAKLTAALGEAMSSCT